MQLSGKINSGRWRLSGLGRQSVGHPARSSRTAGFKVLLTFLRADTLRPRERPLPALGAVRQLT
jgi:hypothetical protein